MRYQSGRVWRRRFATWVALLFFTSLCVAFSSQDTPSGQRPPDGDVLFRKNCAGCHGKDGRAKTFKAKFNHARNLADPVWQAAISDEHIYESILHGKEKMPAFGKKLSPDEVAALVTYVRMLKR